MKRFTHIAFWATLLVTLFNGGTAAAYTVDEIIANSDHLVALYKYSPWKTSLTTSMTQYPLWFGATNGETLKLTKLSDKEILMSGFKGTLDLVFVLYNSTTKKIDTDGDELRFYRTAPSATILNGVNLTGKTTSINGTKAFGKTGWKFTEYNVTYMQSGNGGYWYLMPTLSNKATSNTFISFKIKKDNNGLYFLSDNLTLNNTFARMFTLHSVATQETNITTIGGAAYMPATFIDNIEMVPIRDFNMEVTEKYSHFKYHTATFECLQTVERRYPVSLEIDEASKTFIIRNFSNLGFAYSHTSTHDAVNFNSKNASTYSSSLHFGNRNESYQGVGDRTFGHNGEDYVSGTIDSNGNLVIDRTKIVRNALLITSFTKTTSTAADYWNLNWYDMRPTYFVDNGDRSTYDGTKEIIGTITQIEDGTPQHNSATQGWVTNGGVRRTYDGGRLVEFSPYTYVASSYNGSKITYKPNTIKDLTFVDSYTGVEMHDLDGDCTVDVTLNLDMVGVSDDNSKIGVKGYIETNENDQYVDHYELMVVPGHFSNINDAGFIYDATLGHSSATSLWEHGGRTSTATRSLDNAKDYQFAVYVDASKLKATSTTKQYTFFIKTVYKEDTGLEPTFHDMKFIPIDQVTGVAPSIVDNIEDAPVEYFNLQGIKVAEPTPGNFYIKRQGNKIEKIFK